MKDTNIIIDSLIKTVLTVGTLYWVIAVNYYSYTIGFKFLIPLLVIAFVVSFILLAFILRGIK